MAGIFKAYDIRGIYGETLTDDQAFKIGRAIQSFLGCKRVVIGRDMRPHSKPLFDALSRGLTLQGADVIDLGLCSTPMSYFANKSLGADASIMITASHNPAPWNGFKICRAGAIPLSGASGILDIERMVQENDFSPAATAPGTIQSYDICPEYASHFRAFADIQSPLHILADYANAMGIYEAEVFKGLSLDITPLFATLDGTFPNHEANPLNTSTLAAAQAAVRAGHYDFGACFDGDADRVGFLDETGAIIPMDMITALIAKIILKKNPGAHIFYDLRSSWAVREVILEAGGIPHKSRVGHAFIKAQMREQNALFAGELSGHYYFKENSFAESSALAVLYIANLLSQSDHSLSQLIAPIQRYFASGEINSSVADADHVLEVLRARYADARIETLDGLSFEYENWWFNVRRSNTEPLIRLNLEAKTAALMEDKREEVLGLIRG